MTTDKLESMAQELEASGRYRVLRRFQPRRIFEAPDGSETRIGVFLDLETTGLDPVRDEIIEIAMVPFTYGQNGHIFEVLEPFNRLREPSIPIPLEVTALTGIDAAMVEGKVIDMAEVAAIASSAAIIIAHNAAFDRRFAERFCDAFTTRPWACSMTEVDWRSEGFDGLKLSYLASGHGFYFDGHRAVEDCQAGIEILAQPLRSTGRTAFTALLESARRPQWRIWAENSPFELKDHLKARGYKWNGVGLGGPRAWYVDVAENLKEAELHFLRNEIYQREIELLIRRITAFDRYSDRY